MLLEFATPTTSVVREQACAARDVPRFVDEPTLELARLLSVEFEAFE